MIEVKKVITVDWDDTLFEDPAYMSYGLWIPAATGAQPIERIHDYIKKKSDEGFEIHVVSFREEKDKQEMIDLAGLYNLPIKTFICTSGKSKTSFLKKLGSQLHIDDNVEVLVLAKQADIDGLLVDHNQQDINCTATLFDKI